MYEFPYTNFHELNLDWIISTIKQYGSKLDNYEPSVAELVRNEVSRYVIGNNIDVYALLSGTVNIRYFNPAADGVKDDASVFDEAVTFCNTYGVSLHLNSDRYYISRPLRTTMRESVYGHGATIITGASNETDTAIFRYDVSEGNADIIINAESVNRDGVTDQRLFNKVFHLVTDVSIGNRGAGVSEYFVQQTLITDDRGYFVNTPLSCSPVSSCTATHVREANYAKQIYFGDINIVYGSHGGTCLISLVDACADNMTINNINVQGYIVTDEYAGSAISLHHCTGCTVNGVNGANPVPASGSGYILNISAGSNNAVNNCCMRDGVVDTWGAIGCNYLTNTIFSGVTSNRIDCHYMAFGYFTIKDCTVAYISLPEGGEGITNIYRCEFVGKSFSYIRRRVEMAIVYSGSIVIKDCAGLESTRYHNLMDYSLRDNAEVITENITFTGTSIRIEGFDSPALQSVAYIHDGGFYNESNLELYISDIVLNTNINSCPIRVDANRETYIAVTFERFVIKKICAYLGSENKIKFTFVNCRFNGLKTADPHTGNTARFYGCILQQPGNYLLEELIVIGCRILNATSATRFNAPLEKLVGNICPEQDAAWNNV